MFEKKTVNGIDVITLRNAFGKAEISTLGAHVMDWTPVNEAPVLWMSKKSLFESGKAIRGGIPVCWPWFGGAKKPSHGFARIETWQVAGVYELACGATQLVLTLDAAALADFPFHAQYAVTMGKCLEVALTVENRGKTPVSVTGALHTYFAVSDIAAVRISGLDGAPFEDRRVSAEKVTGHVQEGEIAVDAEVDRLYPGTTADVILSDLGTGRSILVEKLGSYATVVWNPWIAKAAAMPDFGDDEYHDMICIEAANAGSDVRELVPGVSHTLAQKITVL